MNALSGRNIHIIGAGIAGLTVAIALSRRGARVTIAERAGKRREVGAGIQISPNAGRVLAALGLDEGLAAIAPRSAGVQMRDQQGRRVAWLDYRRLRPGQVFRNVHRARLVELLEDAAKDAGVVVRLGQAADAESPFPDADLVIGADGLHSVIRPRLNGAETPFFTGQTAWRALIPDGDGPARADLFMGPGRHLVSYPLGGGIRNIVAVVERGAWPHEGWSHEGDSDQLRRDFAAFGGPVPDWLDRVQSSGIWGLFRHQVAGCWQDGRHVILGDAAHPTLPFMAQGACMAIEDAWILAACLDADHDQPRALARYEAMRAPRCRRIVAAADGNARNYHLGGVRRPVAHGLLRLASVTAPQILFQRLAWIHDFDPIAETAALPPA